VVEKSGGGVHGIALQSTRAGFTQVQSGVSVHVHHAITLAVGVGANVAIFSVLEGVLLKPLPYPHPEELVGVWLTAPRVNITELPASPSMYFTYREQGHAFQDVGLLQR